MNGASTRWAVVALLLVGRLPGMAQTGPRDGEAALKEAVALSNQAGRYEAAVSACQTVIDDPKTPGPLKQRAMAELIGIHSRKGEYRKAIVAAEALRLAFPDNVDIDRQSVFSQADQYWAWTANTNPAPAVAILDAYAKRRPLDRAWCYQAHLRAARFLDRALRFDAAAEAIEAAIIADPDNSAAVLQALWEEQDFMARAKRPEARLKALTRSLEPQYRDAMNEPGLALRHEALAATLRELKRYDELRRFLDELAKSDTSPARRQQWAFLFAETWADQDKTAEALVAYERVFTEHPDASVKWPDAQARIAGALAKLGRVDEALKAARVAYEAAPNLYVVDATLNQVLALLKQADKTSVRVDVFLNIHVHGPAGPDGKVGTADDLAPVLAGIGYPDMTARRQAFQAAIPALGDGLEASLQRGWCCAYTGDFKSALTYFSDALRRCPAAKAGEVAQTVMRNGFRPLRGHSAGLDEVGQFIAWGPAGPDGQAGTADDVVDPFVPSGLSGPSLQPGGRTPLAAGEVKSLRNLVVELRELIARSEKPTLQVHAVNVYQRICEALVVVDRAETLDWIRSTMRTTSDEVALASLAQLGLTVAKADQSHLAGARRFMADVAADFEKAQRPVPGGITAVWNQFESAVHGLEKKASRRTP